MRITENEVRKAIAKLNSKELALRHIMSSKGVPMRGKIYPELDPDYDYSIGYDSGNGDYIINWRKKDAQG